SGSGRCGYDATIGWSNARPDASGRQRCNREGEPRMHRPDRERPWSTADGHPLFSGASWRQRDGLEQFALASTNGLLVAVQEAGQIADRAMPEFDGLDGRVAATLVFGQRVEKASHGFFDFGPIGAFHGFSSWLAPLRSSRIPLSYPVPERRKREVNKA